MADLYPIGLPILSEEPSHAPENNKAVILDVIVKPGSKRPGISYEEGALIVRVRERAVEGAANAACRRALAQEYRVPQSAVELIAGARSRRKRFAIAQPRAAKGPRTSGA
jgi:uncharacterized protein YggU (UPF0235/DUF167 family)